MGQHHRVFDARTRAAAGARTGLVAVAPLLVGIVPFGFVAGATPVAHGMGWAVPIGFSTIVFAGASQLAAIEVLTGGGSVPVAVLAACTINLRMVLYSASIAPYTARIGLRRRITMAYLLTDQAYAVSIVRWAEQDLDGRCSEEATTFDRFWTFVGAGATLWTSWQISTLAGVVVGAAVPPQIHLEFAVPLSFLVLLVPTLVTRPAVVAAAVGGGAAVLAGELGAGPASILLGSLAGIVAGAVVDRDVPLDGPGSPPPGLSGDGTHR